MKETSAGNVKIAYEDLGSAEPALLLMPAWCMSHHGFDKLPQMLSEKHRVLALDWRGHGASETPKEDFGWQAFLEDALAVIEDSGVQQVIPVTLSHSGWAAVELRRKLGPERVPKIINLDWIVLPPPPFYMEIVRALATPEGWEPTRDKLFEMWLEGVKNPDLISFVRDEMGGYSGEMWMRSGREIGACYDSGEYPLKALATLDPPAPTLHLYSQPPDPAYLAGQQQFGEANPWFHVTQLQAHSHFPTFEVAQEIAQEIEIFVG